MVEASSDFRIFLQEELVRRIRTKPGYSMRAFARYLGIDSSRLSKMLRGERPIKPHFIEAFGQKIGLEPNQIETFKSVYATKRTRGKPPYASSADYRPLDMDTFQIISDWQHYAILELMKIRGFDQDTKWIAKALGIQPAEVNAAVERLMRVGLISVDPMTNKWVDTSAGFSTSVIGPNYTSYAHKKLQEQILRQAQEALQTVAIEKRDQSAITMAIPLRKMEQAKQMIKEFRRQLSAYLESDEMEKDAVYQLSVSLFPVSQLSDEKVLSGSLPEADFTGGLSV